ncbi:amine oxidase [Alternaria alternata]|nr:amine oxidase [Alternaria alternata]
MFPNYLHPRPKNLLRLSCGVSFFLLAAAENILPSVDVAIIGGGFSGLVAAKDLVAANKSVVVLEARDRVGGRVFDTQFPDGTATYLGAQFVGPGQTRMVALSKEMGVDFFTPHTEGNIVLYINGTRSQISNESNATGSAAIDNASLAEIALVEKTLDSFARELDPAAPWDHPRANEWDSQTFSNWLDSNVISPYVKFAYNLLVGAGVCEEIKGISFFSTLISIGTNRAKDDPNPSGLLSGAEGGAEAFICKGGCQNVAIRIAKLLGPTRVQLNSPVRLIEKTRNGYKIQTDNGIVTAQKVVIAIPPAMAARIRYLPPLPAGRDQLSQRTPMGSVAKIIAQYKSPFWRASGLSGRAFSNMGLSTVVWDISPEDGSSGVLLGFVSGDRARSIDGKSQAEIESLATKDFVSYFGAEAANVKAWKIQQWDQEEYTRGGFDSNYGPGTLTSLGKYLAAPYEGIHFAGVETAQFWRGYMDGAISAGERVAAEVLDSLSYI